MTAQSLVTFRLIKLYKRRDLPPDVIGARKQKLSFVIASSSPLISSISADLPFTRYLKTDSNPPGQ